MKAQDVRRNILKVIDRIQGDSASYVNDGAIASEMKVGVEDVRGHLGILEQQGKFELIQSSGGYSAYLKPMQRQLLQEDTAASEATDAMRVMAYERFDSLQDWQNKNWTRLITDSGDLSWDMTYGLPAQQLIKDCENLAPFGQLFTVMNGKSK